MSKWTMEELLKEGERTGTNFKAVLLMPEFYLEILRKDNQWKTETARINQ